MWPPRTKPSNNQKRNANKRRQDIRKKGLPGNVRRPNKRQRRSDVPGNEKWNVVRTSALDSAPLVLSSVAQLPMPSRSLQGTALRVEMGS